MGRAWVTCRDFEGKESMSNGVIRGFHVRCFRNQEGIWNTESDTHSYEATRAVTKKAQKNSEASTAFQPITSAILVQCSSPTEL